MQNVHSPIFHYYFYWYLAIEVCKVVRSVSHVDLALDVLRERKTERNLPLFQHTCTLMLLRMDFITTCARRWNENHLQTKSQEDIKLTRAFHTLCSERNMYTIRSDITCPLRWAVRDFLRAHDWQRIEIKSETPHKLLHLTCTWKRRNWLSLKARWEICRTHYKPMPFCTTLSLISSTQAHVCPAFDLQIQHTNEFHEHPVVFFYLPNCSRLFCIGKKCWLQVWTGTFVIIVLESLNHKV